MKYAFIERERPNYRINTLCRVIQVSKAGFYGWRERNRCPTLLSPKVTRLALETAARAAHAQGRQTTARNAYEPR